ncbi:MAG: lipid II flippase MurJ [Myxococcota bacterium]
MSEQTAQTQRIGSAAVLLAGSVLLSRLLGVLRETLLAYLVGAGNETDAYYAAFQLPDMLNYFLAGSALSIAFLPRYTQIRQDQGEESASRFFGTVLGTLGTLSVCVTVVMWWYASELVALQFPRFDSATHLLTTRLTRIVLPAQVFFIVGGILRGPLFARGRFGAAALAPLI